MTPLVQDDSVHIWDILASFMSIVESIDASSIFISVNGINPECLVCLASPLLLHIFDHLIVFADALTFKQHFTDPNLQLDQI